MRAWAKPSSREVVLSLPRHHRTEVSTKINVWCDSTRWGIDIKELSHRFEIELGEGHGMADHVLLGVRMPPKYRMANTRGKLKGKSAMMIHQRYGQKRNFVGWIFGLAGMVGLDEVMIRQYIRTQEERDKQEAQLQ
jgi:putative transposase